MDYRPNLDRLIDELASPDAVVEFDTAPLRFALIEQIVGLEDPIRYLIRTFDSLEKLKDKALASGEERRAVRVVDLETMAEPKSMALGLEMQKQQIAKVQTSEQDTEERLRQIERRLMSYLICQANIQHRKNSNEPFKVLPDEQSAIAKFEHRASEDIAFLLRQLGRLEV